MARLVAAFGTSHSPMMVAPVHTWEDGSYIDRDRQRPLYDADGRVSDYEALCVRASGDETIQLVIEDAASRHASVQVALQRLAADVAAARLDALVVVGDDQHELFTNRNMPAIGIYHGSSIRNAAASADPRLVYPEPDRERHYPCDAGFARHLIGFLLNKGFDIAAMDGLTAEQSEGHAFSFVHRFLMGAIAVPIVPLFLNAYYEPNQPLPARCFDLGAALAMAVDAFPTAMRIGIIASGGLSHFVVDEPFDRRFIEALHTRDHAYLRSVPLYKLQSGSSEIRNWICLAGAAADLTCDWITYVPGYRTPARTGTGLCLASFREGDETK